MCHTQVCIYRPLILQWRAQNSESSLLLMFTQLIGTLFTLPKIRADSERHHMLPHLWILLCWRQCMEVIGLRRSSRERGG